MMGLKAQLAYHGASSVRDLKAKLGTPHDSLRKLIQVSALHKAFRSLGGATGALGLPAGSVAFAADGTASRDYRGGRLRTMGGEQPPTWDYALRVKISCVGFRCNDESDEYSSSDEPYFIMSVIGPGVANTVMKGPYSVDDGDTINDVTVVCADVVPNELVLSTVIRENDQGSPEQAKNLILDRAREIATVAGAAYAIASGDGGSGNAAPNGSTTRPRSARWPSGSPASSAWATIWWDRTARCCSRPSTTPSPRPPPISGRSAISAATSTTM